ncbi:GNAT family N-acetyltransferase [Lactobacillus equicursoris]|uniref:GNAT family N-acetyltransferase n=1 Tax=Lactobacillus equicursoris TaxID=420645 RepID=UPI002431A4F3|nr:GNAT family N-acetyltransferase [Lactobacillus equicursoris]MDD6386980.1 GNAT family N-acetyltransferase [Lactobacillus equicursoris]
MRKELFLELGEITTETDVEELESASKKYYLDHIGKDLLNWGIRQDGDLAAIGSLCLFSRIPYQENLTGQEGYILNIFTSKNYRKQGMANQILDAIIDEAKKRGVRRLWLSSSDQGKPIYLDKGFREKSNEMELFLA